ncbi:MAG: arsenate reductase (glutaredoxin) [Pseudomonadota bacterium]|nr:arsenate reductase (glutaredoxin) [Pseudomonadota bacterium]
MEPITLYHNPRCSKSRAALALLRSRGIEPDVVEYLKTPPSVAQLRGLLAQLQLPVREVLRRGEAVYHELGLDGPTLTAAALLQAVHEHPILLERPIAVRGERAVIGRPPERVCELLDD